MNGFPTLMRVAEMVFEVADDPLADCLRITPKTVGSPVPEAGGLLPVVPQTLDFSRRKHPSETPVDTPRCVSTVQPVPSRCFLKHPLPTFFPTSSRGRMMTPPNPRPVGIRGYYKEEREKKRHKELLETNLAILKELEVFNAHARTSNRPSTDCPVCETKFELRRLNQTYCSGKCRNRAARERRREKRHG